MNTVESQVVEQAIPYVNLGALTQEIKAELLDALEKVLDSGHYILGPHVANFENEFAHFCQTNYAVGVANGTSSLYLILKALGIGEGDEVITAPNSFIASASSIALTGARPVFADVCAKDMNLDPQKLETAITSRTKAIMPVHLTGRPAKMKDIMEIAKEYNLFVLEDAAQAVGAKLHGKPVGSLGDAASFSLHPLKNLFAYGDAGIITTSRKDLQEKIMVSRNHGLINRSDCDFFSFNERLDELHAAMLLVQMKYLKEWTERRRTLAFRYNEALKSHVDVPEEGAGEYCVYQTYMIQTDKRDALLKYLQAHQVDVKIHYPKPIHLQKAANYLNYTAKDFPEATKLAGRILSLPLYPTLTYSQQDHIIELIRKFYV